MSGPISATITSAVRRLTPGIVTSRASKGENGAVLRATSPLSRSIASSSWSMRGEHLRDQQPVVGAEAALERLPQRRQLGPQPATGQVGQHRRIVVPLTSASSIARPETPKVSLATHASLIPASSRTLCSRCASRVRSWTSALRYRVRSRSSRIGLGGTKLGRTRPCSTSWQIHTESATSVFRPGTFLRCWAFSSQHSNPSSSR
jgi:hypothetical protein